MCILVILVMALYRQVNMTSMRIRYKKAGKLNLFEPYDT